MTKNENRLLWIFLWTCAGLLFAFSSLSSFDRIRSAKQSELKYTSAVLKIAGTAANTSGATIDALKKKLELLKSETQNRTETVTDQDAPDMAGYIRTALEKTGITPNRYQISGKAPDESVEFVLRCDSQSFFRFLKSEAEKKSAIVFAYMSIKPTSDSRILDVTFRIRYAK